MPPRHLQSIFLPHTIAVIGATPRSGSVGHTLLKNLMEQRGSRTIYGVNPKYQRIGDIPCFPSVEHLPNVPDLAVICTPARTVPELVTSCGQANIRGLVIISAGFRESGTVGAELEVELRRRAQVFPGMRILGPNCLGFLAPHDGLNVSFVTGIPQPGSIAFLSQSGALCASVLDWAKQEKIGFSYFVSLGNMVDIDLADLIDFLANDPKTKSMILYAESITEARRFMSAARAFTREKPIIAYKAGRFEESAKAAASHTGALAGVDRVYEAAFARAGIVRVMESDDLFDCAELLAQQSLPGGPRLAIITNAGGPGVIAADALLARRGTLAKLAPTTLQTLSQQLPSAWSHGNPVDILGDSSSDRFAFATQTVLTDPNVDGVLVILSPQAMTDPTASAHAVAQATSGQRKPVLAAWMGGESVLPGRRLLLNAGIPCYSSPEKAVRAFTYLDAYAQRRTLLYETPREIPIQFTMDRAMLRASYRELLKGDSNMLTEEASKKLLAAYGIPVVKTLLAHSPEEAAVLSEELGFPVALKIHCTAITHKTEVGGVELNLASRKDVLAAFERIITRVTATRPEVAIEGITVQRMVSDPAGYELMLGAKRDPVFGLVLLIGMGGIAVEVMQDQALELPPLNERLARRMLESLRCWPLLRGFRGRPAVHIDRLVEVLIRASYLVADHPEIMELDVNPLLATSHEVIALDARIMVDRTLPDSSRIEYSHLAIRPYPEEFEGRFKMKCGEQVLLRPIRPEDEPRWHKLIGNCSPESIRHRFLCLFNGTTHEMGARFCFLDYDREIAIVAERQAGDRALLGVGRLSSDAEHRYAEFSVLVCDAWHGQGLGSALTDHCLNVCRRWQISRVFAETETENYRMLDIFRHRGFQFRAVPNSNLVHAVKELPYDT